MNNGSNYSFILIKSLCKFFSRILSELKLCQNQVRSVLELFKWSPCKTRPFYRFYRSKHVTMQICMVPTVIHQVTSDAEELSYFILIRSMIHILFQPLCKSIIDSADAREPAHLENRLIDKRLSSPNKMKLGKNSQLVH